MFSASIYISFTTINKKIHLVLIPLVVCSVSPFRKANVDGASLDLAIFTTVWHCSAVANCGKYNARGFQLKTCSKASGPHDSYLKSI